MPMQDVCVICGKALPIPRRADTRYCRRPSTCRVQAYRARKPDGARPRAGQRKAWRLPAAYTVLPGARRTNQHEAFRALRKQQKRTAELAAQQVQVDKDADQQRVEPKGEAQAPLALLVAALQQFTRIEATLQGIRALVETQTAAVAQDSARASEEQKRAARLAEEQSSALAEGIRGRDKEKQRADALEERLASTLTAASEERVQYQLTLSQQNLQLCEARAAARALADASQLSGVEARRLEAEQQINSLTKERDDALEAAAAWNRELTWKREQLTDTIAKLNQAKAYIAKELAALLQLVKDGERSSSIGAELSAARATIRAAMGMVAEVFAPAPFRNDRLARLKMNREGGD